MASTIKNFADVEVGTVFTRKFSEGMIGDIQFIKIERPNGKYGAMAYSDFKRIVGGNFVPLLHGTYNLHTDCCNWSCVICNIDTEAENKALTEKNQPKTCLLVNKYNNEILKISAENVKLFEYLYEYLGEDDQEYFDIVKADSFKEF